MKIVFIEDDLLWIDKIKKLLLSYQFELNQDFEIYHYQKIEDLYQHESIDLLLLDIEIGNTKSFEYYNKITKSYPNTWICYITSHLDYMIDAFGIHVSGYVLKSDLSKLKTIVCQALEHHQVKGQWFNTLEGKRFIQYKDILYITSLNKKIYLHTNKEVLRLYDNGIVSLEKELPNHFILINKQDLINLDKITFVSKERLDLNHQTMPFTISRRKYNHVIDAYMQRIGETML